MWNSMLNYDVCYEFLFPLLSGGSWRLTYNRWCTLTWLFMYQESFVWARVQAAPAGRSRGRTWPVSCSFWHLWSGSCWGKSQPRVWPSCRRRTNHRLCVDMCLKWESPPTPAGNAQQISLSYLYRGGAYRPF